MNSLICILLSTFAFNTVTQRTNMSYEYNQPEYIKLAYEILDDAGSKLSKKYHMDIIGVTEGLMDRVNFLGFDFQIKGPLSKDELRKILINSSQEFLTIINLNEEIRPYLKNYPFLPENIEIDLFVIDSKGEDIFYPNIGIASAESNSIVFYTKEPNTLGKYKTTEKETYAEALKIVNQQKN